jgi:hypothetical protein
LGIPQKKRVGVERCLREVFAEKKRKKIGRETLNCRPFSSGIAADL